MLDAHFIREQLEAVKANCRNRNVKADPDQVVQLDDDRKRLVKETQTLQQRANEVAKITGKEKDPAKKQNLIQEGRDLRAKVAELEAKGKQIEVDLRAVLLTIPNMTHPDAPVSTDPAGNKVIKT